MSEPLDEEVRTLRSLFWSARDPDGHAFAPLADAYRRKGELDEAQLLIRDGLGRLPEFSTGHLVAARVARDRGDFVAAHEHLERAVQLDRENVVALLERAKLGQMEGSREEALSDVRAVLTLDPGNADATALLEALEVGGEGEAGASISAASDRGEPEWEELKGLQTRTMAELYARQGLIHRAVEVYEHLGRSNPDDPGLAERLDELRAELQRPPAEDTVSEVEGRLPEPESEEEVFAMEGDRVEAPEVESEGEPETPAETISQYLEELLAWVPGAVSIESLAPESETLSPGSDLADSGRTGAAGTSSGSGQDEDLDEFQAWLDDLKT